MNTLYKILTTKNNKLKETVEYINGYFYTAAPKKLNEDYSTLIKDFENRGFEVTFKEDFYVSNCKKIHLKDNDLCMEFYPHKGTGISFFVTGKNNHIVEYLINAEKVDMICLNTPKKTEMLFMLQMIQEEKTRCVGNSGKYQDLKNIIVNTEIFELIIENRNSSKKEMFDLVNITHDINIKNNIIICDFIDIISNNNINKTKLSY